MWPINRAQSRAVPSALTIEQFLSKLDSRSLQPKESTGLVSQRTSQDFENIPLLSDSIDDVTSDIAAYPMPKYLAESFKQSLAIALEEDAERITKSIRLSVLRSEKPQKIRKAADSIRKLDTRPKSVRDIFNNLTQEDPSDSLELLLTQQRRSGEGNKALSFGNAWKKFGEKFIAANPVSLMRRYIFLTQLGENVKLMYARDNEDSLRLLNDVISIMLRLNEQMQAFYSLEWRSLVARMNRLVTLISERHDPNIEILVRLLLLSKVATLDKKMFAKFSRTDIKSWLIEGDYPDRETFIQAVAEDIQRASEVARIPIRAYEKALLEIVSFQVPAILSLTALDHQANIETVIIHLGACLDKYFAAPSLREDAKVMDLSLFNQEEVIFDLGGAGESKEPEPAVEEDDSKKFIQKFTHPKMGLYLITNLKSHWQAMLDSNINVGSITATTLALVNSGDRVALNYWQEKLIESAKTISSSELQVNASILNLLLVTHGKDFDLRTKFNSDLEKKDFQERITYYTAMIAFAEVLLEHVVKEQSQSIISNFFVNHLCLIVSRYMNRVHYSIVSEEVCGYLRDHYSDEGAEELNNKLGWKSITLDDLIAEGNKAVEPLRDLQTKIESFEKALISACFDKRVSKANVSIVAIRTCVYGPPENIINPNTGVAFLSAFETAKNNNNDLFFIKAFFTLEHYPDQFWIEKPSYFFSEIAGHYAAEERDNKPELAALWKGLSDSFNAQNTQNLFKYCIANEYKEQALKIATFGFSYKGFGLQDNKRDFARDIILAFSKFGEEFYTSIAEQAAENGLSDALEYCFKNISMLIFSGEALDALNKLAPVAKLLKNQYAKRCFFTLRTQAKKQMLARKFLTDVYPDELALEAAVVRDEVSAASEERAVEPVVSYDDAIDIAFGVESASNLSQKLQQDVASFNHTVDKVTTACFPEGYNYYENRENDVASPLRSKRASAKLTPHIRDRDFLTKKCREKIVYLLKEEKLAREALIKELNGLRETVVQGSPLTSTQGRVAEGVVAHSMGPLADREIPKELGYTLEIFVKKAKDFHGKLNALYEAPSSSRSPMHPSVSALATLTVCRRKSKKVDPSRDRNKITDKVLLLATTWFDDNDYPETDTKDGDFLSHGNASPELRAYLDLDRIIQENLDKFMVEYRNCSAEDPDDLFAQRLEWINAGRSFHCWENIVDTQIPGTHSNAEYYGHEYLTTFVKKLTDEGHSAALEKFIWAVAEHAVRSAAGTKLKEILGLLENQCQYDWARLVFLGCKLYVTMTQEKRPQLLQALVKIAEPLTKIVTTDKIHAIDNLNVAVKLLDSSNPPSVHISNYIKGVKAVRAPITEEIYNFIGGDNFQDRKKTFDKIKIDLETRQLPTEEKKYAILDSLKARCEYAAYVSIKMLKSSKITDNGTDVYYHIYTLAQASQVLSLESRFEDQQFKGIVSRAKFLLTELQSTLKNPAFARWHQDMLDVSKGLPSPLDALIRHKPHTGIYWQDKLEDPRSRTCIEDLNKIEQQPYYWQPYYWKKPYSELNNKDYRCRFAYEAHAAYELEKLYRMKEFLDESSCRKRDETKYDEEIYQESHKIEQQALAFMAAKYFYEDAESRATSSPFKEAILLIAAAAKESADDIILNLLTKACKNFNDMLCSDEASYGLTATNNVSLKREMKRWITSCPQIATCYITTTLETGIHSEELANFILEFFHNKINYKREDAVNLLLKVFEWKYKYISKGIPKPASWIFTMSDTVIPRLNDFLKQVEAYSLWQPYYAYIASIASVESAPIPPFACYQNSQSKLYRVPHAMKLWKSLQAYPCENENVLEKVLVYILESWSAAVAISEAGGLSLKKFLESVDDPENQSFFNDAYTFCIKFFCDIKSIKIFDESEYATISATISGTIFLSREFVSEKIDRLKGVYEEHVPESVRHALNNFAKKLQRTADNSPRLDAL